MSYSNPTKQKEAQHEHYIKNKNYFYERTKVRRKNKARWLQDFLSTRSCIECNETSPECLDFHHVDPNQKEGTVSAMINSLISFDRIRPEIEKCVILCSNCHRKVHKGTVVRDFNCDLIKLTEEDIASWKK